MKGTEGGSDTDTEVSSLTSCYLAGRRRQSYYEIIMKSPVLLILIIHNCHRSGTKFEGGKTSRTAQCHDLLLPILTLKCLYAIFHYTHSCLERRRGGTPGREERAIYCAISVIALHHACAHHERSPSGHLVMGTLRIEPLPQYQRHASHYRTDIRFPIWLQEVYYCCSA